MRDEPEPLTCSKHTNNTNLPPPPDPECVLGIECVMSLISNVCVVGLIDGHLGERLALEQQVRERAELQLHLEQDLHVTRSRLHELEHERQQIIQERELLSRQQDAMRDGAGSRELRMSRDVYSPSCVICVYSSSVLNSTGHDDSMFSGDHVLFVWGG